MEEPLSSRQNSPLLKEEIEILKCVVDIVIPPDASGPGGIEAGVPEFLVGGLSESGYFPKDISRYRQFTSFLSTNRFLSLNKSEQECFLDSLEGANKAIFGYIVEQIQEGYYTSPAGLDLVGWTVTG